MKCNSRINVILTLYVDKMKITKELDFEKNNVVCLDCKSFKKFVSTDFRIVLHT